MTADDIIKLLGLIPHPQEGGYFRETYRSTELFLGTNLPARYKFERSFSSAIFYLLTPNSFSSLHRLKTDEIFHFYLGDPVTMLQLYPDGLVRLFALGHDLEIGQKVQVLVPQGVWQGAFLNAGGQFALLGTTMTPGFDFEDYEAGEKETLIREYPECAPFIEMLAK